MHLLRVFLISALFGTALSAQDAPQDPSSCPAYPGSVRTEVARALDLDRAYSKNKHFRTELLGSSTDPIANSSNFIDKAIWKNMAADAVQPAAKSSDTEFLRRIYVDLTGRIPTPEQATAFLNDPSPDKRSNLIDLLLTTSAYNDQLTQFFTNRFKVTRAHETISTAARDVFYAFVRKMVATDQPYNEFATQLLTAAGEVDTVPGTQFFTRWMDTTGPLQDSWDNITEKITTGFLGYKTECISCHNGRAHLEKINLALARRSRADFWKMSAFLSRMYYVRLSDDPIGFRPRIILTDRNYGTYSGSVSATNPGCRPPRVGAVVTPAYFGDGTEPLSGNWRQELAGMITKDRQFAKAAVNYLWSYLFGYGIVDPPDAWDMLRVDPNNPPPGDWPLQNSQPELLEQLADAFIQNGYHLKPLLQQIVKSETYQLSSRYSGTWKPAYVRYFARHEARRLTAEQIFDSLITATHTEQPYSLTSFPFTASYANQLPDPTEPFTDSRITNFLLQFGRGDWLTIDRTSTPTILGLLFMMNDSDNVNRSMGTSTASVAITNRVHSIDAKYPADSDAISAMFLATLTRYPSAQELSLVMSRRSGPRYQWLSDLQWALLNKIDFAFQY